MRTPQILYGQPLRLTPLSPSLLRQLRCWAVAILFALPSAQATAGPLAHFRSIPARQTIESPTALVQEWRNLLIHEVGLSESAKIQRVNSFFNERIRYAEDVDAWGQNDYWATPLETLEHGQGDCEDYAIAKYFTLLELGVPSSRIRLVYARLSTGSSLGATQRAHMVLAYYPRAGSAPLILDNLIKTITPATLRTDLTPIFSFSGDRVWIGIGSRTSTSSLSRWQAVIARTQLESSLKNTRPDSHLAGL